LNPKNELAHYNLGDGFANKGDRDGAIAENREVEALLPPRKRPGKAEGVMCAYRRR
jgi:hypothetical protein